jgi:hypothetical protein
LSKGRAARQHSLTPRFLIRDKTPFYLVVEEPDYEAYRESYPEVEILVLPHRDKGAVETRNWIWEHSIANGHERHWQLDDNMRDMRRQYKGKRIPMNSSLGFSMMEEFTDRYTNIGIAGPTYQMFAPAHTPYPMVVNTKVYSCMLIRNNLPFRWRGPWNADTDLCLQTLANGLCTLLFNAFMVDKAATMNMPGGNTARYQGDGRLKMAKALERRWPGVVTINRRYNRPQHIVNWKQFNTPLQRREDLDWDEIEKNGAPTMRLKVKPPNERAGFWRVTGKGTDKERRVWVEPKAAEPKVKSAELKKLMQDYDGR